MNIRNTLVAASLFAAFAAVGCGGSGPASPASPSNGNLGSTNRDTAKVEPKILKDEAGPDGSRIVVRQLENGDEVSVRRWESGAVKKVTKRVKDGSTKVIRVVMRDGKVYRLGDPAAIEHAMDWTADQIADAARKLGKDIDGPGADPAPAQQAPAASNRK